MRSRNLTRALGALAVGLAALALAACSEAGPQRAGAQLPELQVTISPAGCGEVAVAAVGSADTAFVYTSASSSTWAHANDTHLEARARAKAGCAFTRWTIHWSGATVGNTTETATRFQFISGMTATAHFSGTPATPTPTPTPTATPTATTTATPAAGACTQTTLGVDPATNSALAADCAALLAAKAALADAGTLDWSADTAMTDWDGVTLGGTPQRVTGLSLMLQGVTGAIPRELGGLTALRTLNLSWNKLLGAIPAELGSLTELRSLDLSRNRLTGGIPSALGGLTKLEHLTLSQNFLDGAIPAGLGGLANLEGLYLYQNRLTGSIPPELENLSSLTALFLGENELSGCVPRALRAVARNDLATLELPSCPLPATTLSYDTYDTAGAVTAAGSYAFLTENDQGAMTAVTTYEGLRDGTTSALLIHKSDAAGTSRATFYDMVEAGDLFEWKQADDCWVRYRVTGVEASSGNAREFPIKSYSHAYTGCSGAIASSSASGSVGAQSTERQFTWSPETIKTGAFTVPIMHGPWLIAPTSWTAPLPAQESVTPPAITWPPVPIPDPDLGPGWTGGVNEGYGGGLEIWYRHTDGGSLVGRIYQVYVWPLAIYRSGAPLDQADVINEFVVVDGRPAHVSYDRVKVNTSQASVEIYDEASGVIFGVNGGPLSGKNDPAVTIEIARKFWP